VDGAVDGAAVVPNDYVAGLPAVAIAEFWLGLVGVEDFQDGFAFFGVGAPVADLFYGAVAASTDFISG